MLRPNLTSNLWLTPPKNKLVKFSAGFTAKHVVYGKKDSSHSLLNIYPLIWYPWLVNIPTAIVACSNHHRFSNTLFSKYSQNIHNQRRKNQLQQYLELPIAKNFPPLLIVQSKPSLYCKAGSYCVCLKYFDLLSQISPTYKSEKNTSKKFSKCGSKKLQQLWRTIMVVDSEASVMIFYVFDDAFRWVNR